MDASAIPPLARALQAYGFRPARTEVVSGGFSGARVWRVTTDEATEWALRASPCGDDGELEQPLAICQWMQFARETGDVFVPRPACLLQPETSGNRFLLRQAKEVWQAEEWMPGAAAVPEPSLPQLLAAARAISRLHQSGRDFALRYGTAAGLMLAVGKSPGLARREQIVATLLASELPRLLQAAERHVDVEFRELARAAGRVLMLRLKDLQLRLQQLLEHDFVRQPILRDLWRPHVLFTEETVTGIVDWNAAAADHPAFDYARLLTSWYGARAVPQAAAAEFLPVGWSSVEHLLLRLCCDATLLLSPVTWLVRLCGRPEASLLREPVHPAMLVRFREVVQAMIELA